MKNNGRLIEFCVQFESKWDQTDRSMLNNKANTCMLAVTLKQCLCKFASRTPCWHDIDKLLTQIFGLCAPISVHMYLFKAKVSQNFVCVCFERVTFSLGHHKFRYAVLLCEDDPNWSHLLICCLYIKKMWFDFVFWCLMSLFKTQNSSKCVFWHGVCFYIVPTVSYFCRFHCFFFFFVECQSSRNDVTGYPEWKQQTPQSLCG